METGQEEALPIDGLTVLQSHRSFDETVSALIRLLEGRSVKLFATIDHAAEALTAGFEMRPTKLLLFGNPRAGTPLMLEAPSAAIDLPLKILIAESEQGTVLISYNTAEYLVRRHHLPADLLANIAVVAGIAKQISE